MTESDDAPRLARLEQEVAELRRELGDVREALRALRALRETDTAPNAGVPSVSAPAPDQGAIDVTAPAPPPAQWGTGR